MSLFFPSFSLGVLPNVILDMESISKQEYIQVISELEHLANQFVILEQENERLFRDLQQVSIEKTQQYGSLHQQPSMQQTCPREPKI